MKRNWLISSIVVVVLVGALTWGFVARSQSAGVNIDAVGSTALQPLVEAAGEDYQATHKGVFINVQGGGTGTGLAQVQAGAVDLGDADLFAAEKDGIDAKKLVDHKVAVVGITPLINKEAHVDALTQTQLIQIFTKQIKNWKEVGGADLPIVLVNRVTGSGTRATFEKWGLKGAEAADAQEQDSSGTVRSIVSTTPGAISYAAFSYADGSVVAPTLDGVKPTKANVADGKWVIWSYEHVYTLGQPKATIKSFLAYLVSHKIQTTVLPKLGYISIHEMQIQRDLQGKITSVK
ncbi:MAG: phosphate ABC transporter substrate-binding protein PstS family protein [Lactobacillaceae bacterium]|jgi:phosphate transport system substrate-binding protein|nr:phosphate ABC transporter substrate-binding protein PstS family protein [Lactobacillaceae bacterium]